MYWKKFIEDDQIASWEVLKKGEKRNKNERRDKKWWGEIDIKEHVSVCKCMQVYASVCKCMQVCVSVCKCM